MHKISVSIFFFRQCNPVASLKFLLGTFMRSEQRYLALIRFTPKPSSLWMQKLFSIATGIHAVQRGIDKICQLRFWPDDDSVCWCPHNTRTFCIFTHRTGALPREFPPRNSVMTKISGQMQDFLIDDASTNDYLKSWGSHRGTSVRPLPFLSRRILADPVHHSLTTNYCSTLFRYL